MTEKERYQKRKAYYVEYAAKNREKRREASRRWRQGKAARPKPQPTKLAKQPAIELTGETLRERFLAFRKAKHNL